MALRPVQVNIKALDASAVGRFWAEALGWSAYSPGVTTYVGPAGGLVRPDPVAVGVDVVPVPEPKTATKNRVHLDLAATSAVHHSESVARLQALGATPADVGQGDVPWTVLADPEGHEFCVLALPDAELWDRTVIPAPGTPPGVRSGGNGSVRTHRASVQTARWARTNGQMIGA